MSPLVLKIALAIHQINPALPPSTQREYASIVVAQAETRALDPWLIVELVHRETHWDPKAVRHEHNGSCSAGLGQVNVPCSSTAPLLDPRVNLHRTAAILAHARATCRADCAALGWVRGYNPGDPSYAPAIIAAVRKHHRRAPWAAQAAKSGSDVAAPVEARAVSIAIQLSICV